MDEIGTCTITRRRDAYANSYAIHVDHADRRIRIARELIDAIRNGDIGPHLHLDGDALTIRDDYGQRYIYRIRWDDYADGGYLAEWE